MSESPEPGGVPTNGGSHSPSTKLLQSFTEAAVPLPDSVEISRVRAIRRDQLEELIHATLDPEESQHKDEIERLQRELDEARRARSTTTRHELPRLARLVEEERDRAEVLEGELELLEGRVQELEGEASARERELEELRGQLEGSSVEEPNAELRELRDELDRLRARLEGGEGLQPILDELSRSEDRSARISVLEDLIWQLEAGRDTTATRQRAFEELREQVAQQQEARGELHARLQETKTERDRLLMKVRELQDEIEHGGLEVKALTVRYSSLEEALHSAQQQISVLEKARIEAERQALELSPAPEAPGEAHAVGQPLGMAAQAVLDELDAELEEKRSEEEDRRPTVQLAVPLVPDAPTATSILEDSDDGEPLTEGVGQTMILESPLAGEALAVIADLREQLEASTAEKTELEGELAAARDASTSIREALECELEAVHGALAEARARLGEVESELSAATAELEERLEDVEHLDDELNSARRAYRDLSSAGDDMERELKARRRALAESRLAEAALDWRLGTVEVALVQRLEAAEEVYADLSSVRARADTMVAERDATLAQLRESLEESRELARARAEELQALQRDLQALRATGDSSAEAREALLRERDEARAKAQSEVERANGLELELAVVKGTMEGAKSAAEMVRREALKSEERRQALEVELGSARATTRLLESDLEAARSVVADRESELEAAQRELDAYREDRDTLADERDELALERDALREERDALRDELDQLREQLAARPAAVAQAGVADIAAQSEAAAAEADAVREEALAEALRERDAAQLDVERLEDELEAARGERGVVRAEVERLSAELEGLSGERGLGDEEAVRREELEEELAWLRTTQQNALSMRQDWERQLEEAHQRQEELSDELEASRERMKELAAKLEEGQARTERAEAVAAKAAVDVVDSKALEENERLRQEVHDLERAHESECWRGLATHRDLVNAHQRLRKLELRAQTQDVVPAVDHEELHAEALRWLVESPDLGPEFASESASVLAQLEEQLRETRRDLRRARQDFRAERKTLLEGVLTAERALETAQDAGLMAETLDRKSRRATERLRRFDHDLEGSLHTLEERLHAQEDLRAWLLGELGRGHPDEVLEGELEEAQEALRELRARTGHEEELRRQLECEAMQAMQDMETERSALEVELARARAQAEEQILLARRLEERLHSTSPQSAGRTRLEDSGFVRQAEKIAVLEYAVQDRDSSIHWLLKELDRDWLDGRAAQVASMIDELKVERGDEVEDLLRWLGSGNGQGGDARREANEEPRTEVLPRVELPE